MIASARVSSVRPFFVSLFAVLAVLSAPSLAAAGSFFCETESHDIPFQSLRPGMGQARDEAFSQCRANAFTDPAECQARMRCESNSIGPAPTGRVACHTRSRGREFTGAGPVNATTCRAARRILRTCRRRWSRGRSSRKKVSAAASPGPPSRARAGAPGPRWSWAPGDLLPGISTIARRKRRRHEGADVSEKASLTLARAPAVVRAA
jgi:hypothetical protein